MIKSNQKFNSFEKTLSQSFDSSISKLREDLNIALEKIKTENFELIESSFKELKKNIGSLNNTIPQ